jgi:hypothetical protein
MNKTLTRAGTHILQKSAGTGLTIISGMFVAKTANTVRFSHVPEFLFIAIPGREYAIPGGNVDPGETFTVTLGNSGQVKLTWQSKVTTTPPPEPEEDPDIPPPPYPDPEPEPEPDPVVDCVVSGWSAWSAWVAINGTQEQRTRTRTILTSPANGGTACPTLLDSETRLIPAPGAQRVLSISDFTYLGMMKAPDSGADLFNSYGSMSGRKVDGQVRLLMLGNRASGDQLFELADTGVYSTNIATAPRMSVVRVWGDIYGTSRVTWDASGNPRDITNSRFMGSVFYNTETELIYWTYVDSYNTTGTEDWCLGATALNVDGSATAYGPWRPSGAEGVGGIKKGPWRCIRLAKHPVTGEMLCGSGVMSGNHSSPWGPDLWAGAFPGSGTASGLNAADITIEKYLTYYPMFQVIGRDGSFTGPLKACRRGDYVFEPILGDSTYPQIDPALNGGVGSWSEVDSLGGSVWIDLDDVHGMLFIGRFGAEHIWYRNAGQGNDTCTHGFASPVGITGGVSTVGYPVFIFYDPADLDDVRAGSTEDYTVDPTAIVNMEDQFGVVTAPITQIGFANQLAGTYFDAETRKLYVCAPGAEAFGIERLPIVHVFHIAEA